jgi:peptide subunit release factor 1 (eRF1)
LPLLAPLLDSHQRSVPHVVVMIDRLGADLHGVARTTGDVEIVVDGDDHPIQRSKPGGWSQRRYQERVQNTWEENAEEVAEAVVRLVERLDARVVMVAGDVRATQLLRGSLPDHVEALVRELGGSRGRDGSEAVTEAEARTCLATVVAEETRQILAKLKEERGQQDRAVDGLQATSAALSEARVAVLLVPEDLDDTTLCFGSDPVPVATSSSALLDLGGDDPQEGPAVDVLIRAALGTGATVRIVPKHALPEQVGAILRW